MDDPLLVGGSESRAGQVLGIGEPVNIAARLQALAAPGAVTLTDTTLALLKDAFECEALGAHRLKGVSEPVRIYRALRRADPGLAAAAEETPRTLAGRESQLDALLASFEMVRTREEPIPHQEILEVTAIIYAGVKDGIERWERTFAGRRLVSWKSTGDGPCRHLLAERFGPFIFGLALVAEPGRMRLVPRRWTAFGVPMPRFLMPKGDSFETIEDRKFRFHVEIRLPILGLMVRYRGWLAPIAPLRRA